MANPNLKKFTLTPREARELPPKVLTILRAHVGMENAIFADEIAQQCNYRDDRKIRIAIRELIRQGHVIASDTVNGYCIARTREEAEATLAITKSRALEDFDRCKDLASAMERKFGVPYQPWLMELEHANAQ